MPLHFDDKMQLTGIACKALDHGEGFATWWFLTTQLISIWRTRRAYRRTTR